MKVTKEMLKTGFFWVYGLNALFDGFTGFLDTFRIGNLLIITGGILTIPLTYELIVFKIKRRPEEIFRLIIIVILIGLGVITSTPINKKPLNSVARPESGSTETLPNNGVKQNPDEVKNGVETDGTITKIDNTPFP